jgi:hypothetical protein
VDKLKINTNWWITCLLITLWICPTTSLHSQHKRSADQVFISKSLEKKFKRDAARLALRSISKEEDLKFKDAEIPPSSMAEFYTLLTTIYQKSPKAQAIERCHVHTFPDPCIDHLIIIFEKSAPWAAPMQSGNLRTDSRVINDLLLRHNLVLEKYIKWDETKDAIIIRAAEPVNMAAIAQKLAKVEGVSQVDLGIPKTRGNDIRASRIQTGWEVSYIIRFGAHVGGAGKIHTWTFQMTDGGSVQFMGENGDEIPDWMECR